MTWSFSRSRSISSVSSNSFFLSIPVFTKMFVSRVPIARCTSTAATVESTPPLSPQMAHLFPTFSRIARVVSSIKAARLRLARSEQEIPEQVSPALCVVYFRVKLDRVDLLFRVLHRGDGILGSSDGSKALRERSNVVSVAVPHAQRGRNPREQAGSALFFRISDAQLRAAIFPPLRLLYRAAERVRDPLHPVANPQDRNSQRQHLRIALGRFSVINRARTAR